MKEQKKENANMDRIGHVGKHAYFRPRDHFIH